MKFIKLLTVGALALFFCSCGDIKEEIYINEDGSGEYTFETDMIPGLTQMSVTMMKAFSSLDSTKAPLNEDSLRMVMEAKIWEDFPEEVDSVLDLSAEIEKEAANDPEKAELMKQAKVFMRGNKKDRYMNMGMSYSFKSPEDLQRIQELLKTTNEDRNQLASPLGKLADFDFESLLKIEGNKVSRKTFSKTEDKEELDLEELESVLPKGKVQTIIHLPREVKSVKGKNVSKVDSKTVIVESGLLEFMTGNTNTDFEIIMKD